MTFWDDGYKWNNYDGDDGGIHVDGLLFEGDKRATFLIGGKQVEVPKSCTSYDKKNRMLFMPGWLASKKGL